jgi:hypothetical protein
MGIPGGQGSPVVQTANAVQAPPLNSWERPERLVRRFMKFAMFVPMYVGIRGDRHPIR